MATVTMSATSARRRNGKRDPDQLFEIVDGKYVQVHVGVRELGLANVLAALIRAALGPEPPGEPFVDG